MDYKKAKDEAMAAGNNFIQSLWTAIGDGKLAIEKFKALNEIESKYGNTTIKDEFIYPYEILVAELLDFVDPEGETNEDTLK